MFKFQIFCKFYEKIIKKYGKEKQKLFKAETREYGLKSGV
jgi:hypothetical protein